MLDPKDVIPGGNIFGLPTAEEIVEMYPEQADGVWTVNHDFRILVASDRYAEFKQDTIWAAYIAGLHPADYMPSVQPDITKGRADLRIYCHGQRHVQHRPSGDFKGWLQRAAHSEGAALARGVRH